jgi:predicted phage tail component-like protein
MANYNSGIKYNFKMPNGGGIYNSAPYIVFVYDNGFGNDIVSNLLTNIYTSDTAIGDDSVQATVTLSPILDLGKGQDEISLSANISTTDVGKGIDSIDSVLCHMSITETGTGEETIGIARTFFIIDSENMLQPLNMLVLGDSRYDTFPSLKEYAEEIPGRHGEIIFDSKLGSGLLELHVASMDGMSSEQKEEFKRQCAKYLNPAKGIKPLVFWDDLGKTYSVKYAGKIDPTQYADWMEFTIPFKMSSSYITGSFEKKQVGSGMLVNDGNVETPLLIEIIGETIDPSIIIGTQTISYSGTIATGKRLIIDTGNITAELDGVNVVDNLSGDLPFMLQPGSTSVVADNKVTIIWRDRWV